ncbi:unnamed protein product [Microthlaspi erraticum]|uniref:F-box associated beta-propeller type 3 domain-containing protein n=1 Tax=Microthlaspi erraticum TaxID=1685480 RepID=A0A6D2HV05_9BRAS|nr:unnamed protein product [Microthlaspi erraticum]
MGKCRCVSKLWSSIIRRPNYNQLFPRRINYTPDDIPKLLFAIKAEKKLYYFSSHDPGENEKSSLVATLLHTHTFTGFFQFCGSICGLVCGQSRGKNYTVAVIYNPVTGESVTTPKVKLITQGIESKVKLYFGYDPVEKQYKVLCVTSWSTEKDFSTQHYVLTLETGNLLWRKIQCCNTYHPLIEDGVCINGVLYYTAENNKKTREVVCFDVRSEKLSLIKVDPVLATKIGGTIGSTLIDYKGKLGAIIINDVDIELWVLEEAKEHKWSKQTYGLSSNRWYYHGVTGRGKIVCYPNVPNSGRRYDRLKIFYYSRESNMLESVEISGFENPGSEVGYKNYEVYTFPNYVEDVKLI